MADTTSPTPGSPVSLAFEGLLERNRTLARRLAAERKRDNRLEFRVEAVERRMQLGDGGT